METDSNSTKKAAVAAATTPPTVKTPLTPGTPGGRKQVGFAKTRPVLIIPPPGQHHELRASRPATATSPYTAGTGNVSSPASNHMYNRKASAFVFEQLHGIKDFTKSGLGVGEKCAYWLYNKIRSWSRKWFTHMFLTIVLLLYTIGGALVFEWVEGQNEKHVEDDLRVIRKNVIRDLQNLSKGMQDVYLRNDFEGQAVQLMMDYEQELLSWHMKHKQYVGIGSNPQKKWNFWNSVVYCGTIYTTIAAVLASRPKITQSLDIMDPPHVRPENASEQSDPKIDEKSIDMARIEALVTPEQVLSASVAKKRRTFTKKRTTSANKRDPTPMREINEKADITTTDEEVPEVRPKTPERRRRRRTLGDSIGRQNGTKSEPEAATDFEPGTSVKKSSSIPRQVLDEFMKRESLIADYAQTEVAAFLTKTKKSIEKAANRGRDRFKKMDKEQVKRSQSAPHTFTQEELIESFRKAQLLDVDMAPQRKYSNSSLVEPEIIEPKELRPEVQEFAKQRKRQRALNKISSQEPEQVDETDEGVKQRKKQRALIKPSPKVVEILDPITSNVIATKVMIKTDFRLTQLFSVLRLFTIKELRANYKAFKIDMKDECRRIRILKNRCMCELFIIMVFCGLGGFLFKFIEGSFENFYKCGVKRVKRDFIELLWMKSHNLREEDWKSLARNRLRIFEEELHTAHEAGMKTYSGQRAWSFLNAVVYCLSIVTTIGYGHIYPDTRTGKALTIVYAIIGIPLFLLALTDFGKLFTRCIKFFWSFVRRLYYTGSCRTVRKTAHVKEIFKGAQMMYEIATFRRPSMFVDPENPPDESPATTQIGDDTPTTPAISNFEIDDEFNLPISLAIFILVLYIFLGGLIYCLWEGWDFFDSFYFVFISMSTVGFGDMVPADAACMIVSIVYLVFGLALMSMCINVVQVKLSDTFKQASTKIGATIGITVSEDDGSINTVSPNQVEMPEVHEIGTEPIPNTSSENYSNIQKENDQKKDS